MNSKDRNFRELLETQWSRGNFVCVGLDSEYEKIPKSIQSGDRHDTLYSFNCGIIDATRDRACAYKPDIAFYERYGRDGMRALLDTIVYIRLVAPDVPVILDAKRGGIGNANIGYMIAVFVDLQADAITVHPYLGGEALQPFLKRENKGIFVLCRTSNPGSGEFQDLTLSLGTDGKEEFWPQVKIHLYQYVAYRVTYHWNTRGNCGLVMGATYPEELCQARKIVGDMPILIPGIGAQGGNLEKVVAAAVNSKGAGFLVNSSRGIIFASSDADFAEAARRETEKLHKEINQYR